MLPLKNNLRIFSCRGKVVSLLRYLKIIVKKSIKKYQKVMAFDVEYIFDHEIQPANW